MPRWIIQWLGSITWPRAHCTDHPEANDQDAEAERRLRRIAVLALLALAVIPLLQLTIGAPSLAHAPIWPGYSAPVPTQQALHGWPRYGQPAAYAYPAPRRTAPNQALPISQPTWTGYAPGWSYQPVYEPQPQTWQVYPGTWVEYPVYPYPANPYPYGHVAPQAPVMPPSYGLQPYVSPGYGPAPMPAPYGYPAPPREPERVYHLTAEDQEVVDELDRRLSRVKRILGQSREFDTEAATVLFLHQVAEALEYMPRIHAEMRAMNNEMQRMNYMMTALPVLAWDLHQVNQKVGLMAWDINRTMGRMGGMMSWMPFL
jgi:hypothetical protein